MRCRPATDLTISGLADVVPAARTMANGTFTKEDEFDPIYCSQCHKHVPRAVIDASGKCPGCVGATQVLQATAADPALVMQNDPDSALAYSALDKAGLLRAQLSPSCSSTQIAWVVWFWVVSFVVFAFLPKSYLAYAGDTNQYISYHWVKYWGRDLASCGFTAGLLITLLIGCRRCAGWQTWAIWWGLTILGAWRVWALATLFQQRTGISVFGASSPYSHWTRYSAQAYGAWVGVALGVAAGIFLPRARVDGWGSFLRVTGGGRWS